MILWTIHVDTAEWEETLEPALSDGIIPLHICITACQQTICCTLEKVSITIPAVSSQHSYNSYQKLTVCTDLYSL